MSKTLTALLFSMLLPFSPVAADSVTAGTGAVNVVLTAPSAGHIFAQADSSTTISYSTDLLLNTFRKITIEIDNDSGTFPPGTEVRVTASPETGQGTGYTVMLTTVASDLIRDIPSATTASDVPVTFHLEASLGAPPGTASRTVHYTILVQ